MTKVYFSKNITKENIVNLYKQVGVNLEGKVAVKVHSGEEGNQNYLKPSFLKDMIDYVDGTVVECNTAYEGSRNSSEKHLKLLESHGWTKLYKTDLLDETEETTLKLDKHHILEENIVGKNLLNYDSLLVISHFKGHPMGGFGGALKQLSIGCASTRGKCLIHSAGKTDDQTILWSNTASQDDFMKSMADAASSVHNLFKGNVVYINIMCNLSVDCDCCAIAEDPCMQDIGILASTDPIALDKACLDLVFNSTDPGAPHLIERIETRLGTHIIKYSDELGFGSSEYELVELD